MTTTRQTPEPQDSPVSNRLLTGETYLESLRDGREIWFDGERVRDITTQYSEFAGRHALYERNYAGSSDQQRLDALNFARREGQVEAFNGLVDQCLQDYDLEGWRPGPWA